MVRRFQPSASSCSDDRDRLTNSLVDIDIDVLMYMQRCQGYGDERALRQAQAVPFIDLVVGERFDLISADEALVIDPEVTGRGVMSSLVELLGTVRTAYAMFGSNAIVLERALSKSGATDCRLVFLTGGQDITGAAAFGPRYTRRLLRAAERAETVLCNSQYIERCAHELGFDPAKTLVHYIGTDIPPLGDRVDTPAAEPAFLAVSRLDWVKGIEFTLLAFAEVLEALPTAVLRILGDGSQRTHLQRLTEQLGIGGSVRFLGLVGPQVVHEQMLSSWVFVQHNVRTLEGVEEALGGSIVEAQARQLPVVGTYSGGVPEAVVDGSTGVLVHQRDVEAMAEAMIELALDEGLRRRMGAAGREFVSSRFDARVQDAALASLLSP